MTTPPTNKECEVILTYLHVYGHVEDSWERGFIRDNHYRDELTDGERWEVWELVKRHLDPLPVTLEKKLKEIQ